MAEQYKFSAISPVEFDYQVYNTQDTNLIGSVISSSTFNTFEDYVESHLYNANDELISSEYNTNYSILDNNLFIDLTSSFQDLIIGSPDSSIFDNDVEATYYLNYNILSSLLASSPNTWYYISEISSDRTEIRLDSNVISNPEIINSALSLTNKINSSPTQYDFYLNFGGNDLIIANNILLDNSTEGDPTILIKLYEALPSNYNLKSECWVVKKIALSLSYKVDYANQFLINPNQGIQLQGPNYNISYKDQINNSTDYSNYSSLVTSQTSSLQYQLNNVLENKGVAINVDYNEYSNFTKFSSVYERIANFYYKLTLIEEYQYSASVSFNTSSFYASSSNAIWESKINNIISKFDGYELFLYQTSGSNAWPKSTSTSPYSLYSPTSSEGQDWLSLNLSLANDYDNENRENLYNSIPLYLQEDPSNAPLKLFVNMLGQHYDNLYLYIKDVSNKFNADNRINYGVSKDLVADIIKDFGLKIYQSNFSSDDLYSAFFGYNLSGSYSLPTNATGGLDVSPNSFLEYITNYVTSSNDALPLDGIQKRVYKRIYHSFPYIIKRKGTIKGLEALSNIYGIPNTILRFSEFGGKDKINYNDWDLWQNKFNYKFDTGVSGFVSSSWELNSDWGLSTPETIQFRFKAPDLDSAIATPSQSLWNLDTNVYITLEYTGSGYTSGSYSGSVVDPYNTYANLVIYPDYVNTPAQSASIYLPFFDGGWWSVMATLDSDTVNLYAGNKIYSGSDGSQLGFYDSGSISSVDDTEWVNGTTSYFASASIYPKFSGSLQEIRYYNTPLSESVFKDYIMNPQSIEGNGINSGSSELAFRAPLGGELYTGSTSIHPKVTGSWVTASSFTSNSDFFFTGSFSTNTEYFFSDQPVVGIKNRISDKISPESLVLPSGNTLSKYISVQQTPYISSSYTADVNYLEAAFSPQNEINDDIVASIGYFDIGQYIGDPRFTSMSLDYYPLLDNLRNDYFLKYKNNYQAYDYIRLIKYFDNSLFKMINDYVPARTSLASGVVIKQHLLERNRYRAPLSTYTQHEYTGSIGQTPTLVDGDRQYIPSTPYESNPLETITGSNGGSLPNPTISQSWEGIYNTPVGQLSFTQEDAQEFINGEFSGSDIIASNGELNSECDPYKEADTTTIIYDVQHYTFNGSGQTSDSFGNDQQPFSTIFAPTSGQLKLWWNSSRSYDRVSNVYNDTYQVEWIKISKTSDNSLNLTDYIPASLTIKLPNISMNPSLSQTTGWNYGTYIGVFDNNEDFIELEILSIQENSTWYNVEVKQVDGFSYYISSYGTGGDNKSTPTPLQISNDNNRQLALNPYAPLSFWSSDCNPLYGNELSPVLSKKFYDLDFSSNAIQAVNQETVIIATQQTGSATHAPVQDFNWYARRSIIPRYIGSENTASEYNSQQGFAPIDYTDPIILDFNWGGGTYPEIANGGALSINQMLFVGATKDSVSKFPAQQPGFTGSVATAFPINSRPVFRQYTTTQGTTTNARVSAIGITTPLLSDYMIASSNPSTTATILGGTNYITFNDSINEVTTDSGGYYTTGSSVTNLSLFNEIAIGLGQGERWFVTMYKTLPYTVQGVLYPYNFNYSNYSVTNGYSYPLASQGVFEIDSLSTAPILPTSSFQAKFGTGAPSGQIGIGSVLSSGSAANAVTYFDIATTDYDGNNKSSILSSLSAGQTLTVENMDSTYPFDPNTVYEGPFVYTITATPTDYGTYYRVPVTFVSATNGTNIRLADAGGNFFFYQIYTDGNSNLYFNLPGDGNFSSDVDFGNGNKGLLIWKSQQGAYMLFNNATLSGVGKGGLLTSTPSPIIETDFEYITQTYGSNPKSSQ